MVEYELPKLGVAGSNPVARSIVWRGAAVLKRTAWLPRPPVAAAIDPSFPTTIVDSLARRDGGLYFGMRTVSIT